MSISLIRDRVQVQILRDTSAVERVSFGIPLFIGETDIGTRVASYANIDEVGEAFAETDPEYLAAQAFFLQQPQPRQLIIGFKDTLETYSEALSEIRDDNDEFYAVAIQSRDDADALLMAPAVSSLPGFRMFVFRSDDANMLDPQDETSIGYQLRELNFDQAKVYYHSQADTLYPDMAQLGRVLPVPESRTSGPGSIAWFDQPIQGLAGDSFTSTQRSALEAINVEYFMNVAGNTRSMGGKNAGGEWSDVIHGIAWLETRLAEDVYELMSRTADRRQKLPYTDEGISRVEGVVRNRLDIAVSTGLLTEPYEVSVPLREDTQFGDRANRILRDVNFEAPLAGAIKFVNIEGVVTA